MKLPWTCDCGGFNYHYGARCIKCGVDTSPIVPIDTRLAKLIEEIARHDKAERRDRALLSIDAELAAQLVAEARGRASHLALDWWLATRSAPPARTARHVAEEQWDAGWARHDKAKRP